MKATNHMKQEEKIALNFSRIYKTISKESYIY